MPRPPNPEVRARLLEAGRGVVHEQGFNGCGVQEITDAAKVPKGSFYNYFDSKESFAAEILEQYWQSLDERHGPLLRDGRVAPLARVRKFFHAVSQDHRANGFAMGCLIGNLSLELSTGSESARRMLLDVMRRWQRALADCLGDAQAHGELGDDVDVSELAAIVIEGYEGAVMRSKIERSNKALDRFEKAVLPRLLR
ncbi:TetR/AcrR family transcriptional regulator [Paraburkholderia caballeronis]|uniref:Transcriptional regulator, TetR family n=1 Tax=Paraburkholderia caballeronis TaxID=416943 RepID=A0A1H7G4N8_9BURK|nr:TetR/AcrR family transcriptional regulator [Paraburkholderia caballeronis]PXW24711.1 TetR family transcriptional regulator [Paraburkholderia caballeronis]PXX00441.1 TetR family transcriptional regulator [Paraburkholderia caballeronis]RAJ98504.1 TetR family transcriptional regulator [Paraburkholderia caballeronis]TDV16675.1 TetR family transcriptional regulator [Paraburkholderia caballeronis]TDV19071.1 TetR family transcriptional regulator [Paraburkholderia caballeronis]